MVLNIPTQNILTTSEMMELLGTKETALFLLRKKANALERENSRLRKELKGLEEVEASPCSLECDLCCPDQPLTQDSEAPQEEIEPPWRSASTQNEERGEK